MPKVSVNILTKDRSPMLLKALASVSAQSFTNYEAVVVNDGSSDDTLEVLKDLKIENLKIINHQQALGITASRQEALLASTGDYIAILDDDDEWADKDKLLKQSRFLDEHPEVVLVGGGININSKNQEPRTKQIPNIKHQIVKYRPKSDSQIRRTMLFRNNFFTSTVMFRRQVAIKVGGFTADNIDLGEDYDLWLRLVRIGRAYNFHQIFAKYNQPGYNRKKRNEFYKKQRSLINRHRTDFPFAWLAEAIVKIRTLL
jgi:glycosyltransferase involved in cell wall biosynthesis